jgi:pimeloyl-ACP methyl ester carboxylesterase
VVLFLILVAVLLTAGCGTPLPGPAAPAAAGITGSWTGRLDLPGAPLDVGVTLAGTPEALTGTLDVPAQGIAGVPLVNVAVDGATVRFTVPGLPGDASFAGTLAADASAIGGSFTQGGRGYPLVLRRGTVAGQERPQEPRPPFPYWTEDVTYRGPAGDLAGTLTLPAGPGPFPAVLLITGSGAQDRDETIAGHRPFLLLADSLTRAGTAVLRVDDRGVGGSAGTTADATYDDLVADIGAGLVYLRGRPELDPGRVGLLGHSEGGYLAPLAAQRLPGAVAFACCSRARRCPARTCWWSRTACSSPRPGSPRSRSTRR